MKRKLGRRRGSRSDRKGYRKKKKKKKKEEKRERERDRGKSVCVGKAGGKGIIMRTRKVFLCVFECIVRVYIMFCV